MNKLRRQIVVLALCLAAVLVARLYVDRFLQQRGSPSGSAAEAVGGFDTSQPAEPDAHRGGEEAKTVESVVVETSDSVPDQSKLAR